MIDDELKAHLERIDSHLVELNQKTGGESVWRSFFKGVLSSVGYFVGLAFIIIVVGWVANKTGVLQDFQNQVKDFQDFIEQAKKAINIGESGSASKGLQKGAVITLPDGRKVQVVE